MEAKERLRDLCDMISLQREVKEQVFYYDEHIDYTALQASMDQLFSPETWDEGQKALEILLDPDENGLKMLTCMLVCGLKTREMYERAGIPEEIFRATMKCFTRFIGEHYRSYGYYGFDRAFWTSRQLAMKLFRIGELEYELKEGDGEGEEEKCVHLHIPSDCDLRMSSVKESYRQARAFLNAYYPDYLDVPVLCESWLLAPALKEELSADSHILKFQKQFEILSVEEDNVEFLVWLYGRRDIPPEELSEKTSLQRNVKKRLLAGGKVGAALGRIRATAL